MASRLEGSASDRMRSFPASVRQDLLGAELELTAQNRYKDGWTAADISQMFVIRYALVWKCTRSVLVKVGD